MGKRIRKGGFSFASLIMLLCTAGIIVSFFVLPALKAFEIGDYMVGGTDYIRGIFSIEPSLLDVDNLLKYGLVKQIISTGDGMNMAGFIFVYAFFATACVAVVVALLSLITTFYAGVCKKLLMFFNFILMAVGITSFICLLIYNNDLGAELDQVGICMYIVIISAVASFVFSLLKRSAK